MNKLNIQSKMSQEKIELSDDEITDALNKRLDEDAKQEKLNTEVDKRIKVINDDREKKQKETEVREAKFTDETGKKKKTVKERESIECYKCGSTDLEKITDDSDTFVYKGKDISAVYHCNECGRNSGVAR